MANDAVRAAYAAGITPTVATDADVYLSLTLSEIADEWRIDPIVLLAALAKVKYPDGLGEDWTRHDGETFAEYLKRLLPS